MRKACPDTVLDGWLEGAHRQHDRNPIAYVKLSSQWRSASLLSCPVAALSNGRVRFSALRHQNQWTPVMEKTKLYLIVLLIRVIYTGMQIIIKAAFDDGMNTAVFVFYFSWCQLRLWKRAPALSFWLAFKMFMLALDALAGTLYLYSVALDYTSAALASAAINFIPVTTFILAVIFRGTRIAKLCGVGLCIAGAFTIAFYGGPRLNHLNRHHVLTGGNRAEQPLLKQYPSELMFTAMQSLFSAIQTFFITLAIERDFSRWKLRLDMGLISVAYCVRD
ncbi:auxin-induced protein [Musa troglodytarum]|uniref:Auxin-induced protein n=1 Tax=Musa troglodytarum TaxID=320322 RepID=A0A9E7GGP3_9LILI|nr:auxin-induced protein [Musa troglodytarum]